ncbi:dihydroneopterin aldolase [Paracoccus spongiarum]|uniref:dihydroneopterin aldolase n=1 Tax=Paracoccus spongiarum TaxID=3064387 RepID=A0ABT9JEN9_9RHOB|nr:dihydroneopterin aldolase [Paracoccus sp. 2205BS29-5]MDP5308273.1 dihydroneopterin aldolase [Paracoccus sp. 2205BS29-5]
MSQPDRIHLRDHVVNAEIGAFQSERGRTQRLRFAISVDLRTPISDSGDDVDRILSYDVLTEAVDTALADRRYNLVETLAERIAAEILAHPVAAQARVTVEKLDRGPGALGITITRSMPTRDAPARSLPVDLLLWDGRPAALPEGAVVVVPAKAPAGETLPGEAGRRLALLALDRAAWFLAHDLGVEIAETRTELDAAIRSRAMVVWAPARLAVDAPEAGGEPAGLALWLARRLGSRRLLVAQRDAAALPRPPAGQEILILHAPLAPAGAPEARE